MALLKCNKQADDAKVYRPILLLCVSYKIFEKLILAHINAEIEPQLTSEHEDLRQGRSTVQQVLKHTNDIKKSLKKNIKPGK